MIGDRFKSGMVASEVAIGIALSVIVLFVALGLFGDNLSKMTIDGSGIQNLFKGNENNTAFSQFSQDYTGSQINVQITGAQGLQMLRRKANNKAIEMIEESFSKSNTNANSIGYLSMAIKAITGESHICKYMNDDSDEHCDKLGGYEYNLAISGAALTIKNVNDKSKNAGTSVSLAMNSTVASVLSSANVPIDSEGRSRLTREEKYSFIRNLSDKLADYIRSDALLLRTTNSFTATTVVAPPPVVTPEPIVAPTPTPIATTPAVVTLSNAQNAQMVKGMNSTLDKLVDSMKDSYDDCKGLLSFCKNPVVEKDEYKSVKNWATNLKPTLNKAIANQYSTSQITELFTASLLTPSSTQGSLLDAITDDQKSKPRSCDVLTNGINNINSTYGLNITIPECAAGDW